MPGVPSILRPIARPLIAGLGAFDGYSLVVTSPYAELSRPLASLPTRETQLPNQPYGDTIVHLP